MGLAWMCTSSADRRRFVTHASFWKQPHIHSDFLSLHSDPVTLLCLQMELLCIFQDASGSICANASPTSIPLKMCAFKHQRRSFRGKLKSTSIRPGLQNFSWGHLLGFTIEMIIQHEAVTELDSSNGGFGVKRGHCNVLFPLAFTTTAFLSLWRKLLT